MNKYLLLRDNKQSGPYTVEELIAKGLKPYDLVWLDGKSAAWRYPSEIPDFNGFAPAVEEQPYDRFYKKKPDYHSNQELSNTVIQPKQETTAATTVETVVATSLPVTAKKIYVTLPAARNRTATVTNSTISVTAVNNDTEAAQKSKEEALMLSEQFARIREEKIKQAESMAAAKPVVTAKALKQPKTTVNDNYQSPSFSELMNNTPIAEPEQPAPVVKHRGSRNRVLLGAMAAACLLLAGVIIGLVISNSRQQKDSAAIEKLVQQIKERDRNNQAPTSPVQQQPVSVQEPVATPPVQDVSASLQSGAEEKVNNTKSIATPVSSRKEQPSFTHPNKENLSASEPQAQTVKVIPAVVTNKPEEKPLKREEVESAKKNIHQLVGLEANKYKTGVLGGISDLRLTISNNSLYPLDQVEVEVRYLGPEKRVVKTQVLLFNDVPAGEQKTLEVPQTNRGVTVDYTITRINSKALGLAHAGY